MCGLDRLDSDLSVITIFSTTSKSAFLDKNSKTYFAKNPVEVTTYLLALPSKPFKIVTR